MNVVVNQPQRTFFVSFVWFCVVLSCLCHLSYVAVLVIGCYRRNSVEKLEHCQIVKKDWGPGKHKVIEHCELVEVVGKKKPAGCGVNLCKKIFFLESCNNCLVVYFKKDNRKKYVSTDIFLGKLQKLFLIVHLKKDNTKKLFQLTLGWESWNNCCIWK